MSGSKRASSKVAVIWATTWLGVAVLAGCGGSDSDVEASPQPGTGAQAQATEGTVAGMSDTWVLLNGIKYNKTTAQVLDDDDQPVSASALQLGMQVDILATQVGATAAKASNIAFGASVEGTVDSVDAAAGKLVVLGQPFQVSDGTVFANLADGLASLAAGNFAKVQGVLDAKTGITSASRVEFKKSALRQLRLRGVVSEVDNTAKTVKIGGQVVSLAKAKVGTTLVDGAVVRSTLEPEKVNGQFVAKAIADDRRFVADGEAVNVNARLDEVTSNTSFKILGLAVDASKATFNGTAALKVGDRAEVKGALSGGKLVATSVNVKQSGSSSSSAVEMQAAVAELNAAKKTFSLNEVAVSFNDKTEFVGGSAADLANGVTANAKGKLTSNGTKLKADSIEFIK